MENINKLILIDGSFYLYRAYYSFPFLKNSKNEYTGAIYGVLTMINNLFEKYFSKYVAIIFDSKGETFRNKIYKEYKANRMPMPENLRNQILPLQHIIKVIGLPIISINGFEADDIIGTLAKKASNDNFDVLISTIDKDMTQLVNSKVKIIDINSSNIIGPKEVEDKFGILPELMVDYIALVGDKSDNIPGVPGIGKKTAIILLQTFGELKNIYKNLNKVKNMNFINSNKIFNKLIEYHKIAFMSYNLAKIKTDLLVNSNYEKLEIKKSKLKKLKFLFQYYEFNSLLRKIDKLYFIN